MTAPANGSAALAVVAQEAEQEQEAVREPIATTLARVCGELEDIARRIEGAQSLIARTTWSVGASDPGYVGAMQDADLSAQRLTGLAEYLRMIGEAANPGWCVETEAARASLTLAAMAEAMRAPPGTVGTASWLHNIESGDIEMF